MKRNAQETTWTTQKQGSTSGKSTPKKKVTGGGQQGGPPRSDLDMTSFDLRFMSLIGDLDLTATSPKDIARNLAAADDKEDFEVWRAISDTIGEDSFAEVLNEYRLLNPSAQERIDELIKAYQNVPDIRVTADDDAFSSFGSMQFRALLGNLDLASMAPKEIAKLLAAADDGEDFDVWRAISATIGQTAFVQVLAAYRLLNTGGTERTDTLIRKYQTSLGLVIDNAGGPPPNVTMPPPKQETVQTAQKPVEDILKTVQDVPKPVLPKPVLPKTVQPMPKGAQGRAAIVNSIREMAAEISLKYPDKKSPEQAHAQLMLRVAQAAERPMATFPDDLRVVMAKILARKPPFDQNRDGNDLDRITSVTADLLRTIRPASAAFTRNTKADWKDERPRVNDWLKTTWATLSADGFNEKQRLAWLWGKIQEVLASKVPWGKLEGYIFQFNETLKARREYRLTHVEYPLYKKGSTSFSASVDTRELMFSSKEPEPEPRLREYKAYGENPGKETLDEFDKQLKTYVEILSEIMDPVDLEYVFRGPVPKVAENKINAGAKNLKNHHLHLSRQGAAATVVGAETFLDKFMKKGTGQGPEPAVISNAGEPAAKPPLPPPPKNPEKKSDVISPVQNVGFPGASVGQPASTAPKRKNDGPTPQVKKKTKMKK